MDRYCQINEIVKRKIGTYIEMKNFQYIESIIIPELENTDSLNIIYQAKTRELAINYNFNSLRNIVTDRFVIHLRKRPLGTYSVEDILNHEKISYNPDNFSLLNYQGTFEERVVQFCNYIIYLFENYLQDWLFGEKWENIPFDWGIYK